MTRGLTLAMVLLFGCVEGLEDTRPRVDGLDPHFFRCEVQPVLTLYCGNLACHGDARRYYRHFGRNRLRLSGAERERAAPLSEQEAAYNYASAAALVVPGEPDESLLSQKPLAQRAGGLYHGGAERFGGGDVFSDRDDLDYQTLARWIEGETEDPSCVELGSDR